MDKEKKHDKSKGTSKGEKSKNPNKSNKIII
jgi:hypothetical protein